MKKTEDEIRRDEVLKRMLNTPPETKKEMQDRRIKERKRKARESLRN